mgnify:CR=1 FL=1
MANDVSLCSISKKAEIAFEIEFEWREEKSKDKRWMQISSNLFDIKDWMYDSIIWSISTFWDDHNFLVELFTIYKGIELVEEENKNNNFIEL